ncbi:MAG: CRISPR-associated protein Cas5 [Candidatus Delongbacteria bacterium]|nr:CRISPR-associated protein Cas5 [Candidatus Delongbacteria bacterium]
MKTFIVDFKGKFANFKKFYSNSSALSYYFPPRTAITGIFAAILGREKESYHEEFCFVNFKVAIAIKSKLKKSIHKINYLKVENPNQLNGSHNDTRTQVPFEMLSAADFRKQIHYRLYCNCSEPLYEELIQTITSYTQKFPIYLGKAGLSGQISLIAEDSELKLAIDENIENYNLFVTPLPKQTIADIEFKQNETLNIYEDSMPLTYDKDYSRQTCEIKTYIFGNGEPLLVKVKKSFYLIEYCSESENIFFLED